VSCVLCGGVQCTYANGDVYEGCWEANVRNGKGQCVFSSGNVYKGDWVDDVPSGEGDMKYAPLDFVREASFTFVWRLERDCSYVCSCTSGKIQRSVV
jgi:hypothetical protein